MSSLKLGMVLALLVALGSGWMGWEGLGQNQPQTEEPEGVPDPALADLSFELFTDTVVLVTISVDNRGTKRSSGGSGELLLQGPTDDELTSLGVFFFGTTEPGATTRAGGQFDIGSRPDGPYTVVARFTNAGEDSDPDNNERTESFTLLREPQLRPIQIDFSPPFFNPELVSTVQVRALVANFGLQPRNTTEVEVEFAFCRVEGREDLCDSDSFSVFSTRTLDLNSADRIGASPFVLNPTRELRVREWGVSACLPLVPPSASARAAGCPQLGSALDPGVYVVRVRVDPNNALPEADENDNVEFARFTVPGETGTIFDLVVGINGEGARGMMYFRSDDSELVGVDKREFERIATCLGVRINSCPYEGNAEALSLIEQFTEVTPNPDQPGQGTVRIDVFDPAFETFDQQITPLVLQRLDVRPARITTVAQNRSRQVLYVGLSDGRLIRINFANASDLRQQQLTVDATGEVGALQVVGNGVYVGVNSPNASAVDVQSKVVFVEDTLSPNIASSRSLPIGNRIESIALSPTATTVFAVTAQENRPTQPKLQLWWASNVIQGGQLTGLLTSFQQVELPGLGGDAWDDLAVNARLRLFLSTSDADGNSRLYGYRLSKSSVGGQEQLGATRMYGPVSEFVDQCDNRRVPFTKVDQLALGDDTPSSSSSGDQVLHVTTADDPRVLTLQVQVELRVGSISLAQDVTRVEELLAWWVPLDGRPSSIKVDDAGGGGGRRPDGSTASPNGVLFVPAQDSRVYVVDGRQREACSPKIRDLTLATGAPVTAPMDTGENTSLDFLTGETNTRVFAFYAADGIYIWTSDLNAL